MGAVPGDRSALDDEFPRHPVRVVGGVWMARTPVTVAVYRRYCDVTGKHMPKEPDWNPRWRHTNYPIVNVTWNEAAAFCQWTGGRLPTEAEWEYAARAGTRTRYWWGEDVDGSKIWFRENAAGRAHGIKTRPANPWGLFDLLGNVWEWCADNWHPDYTGAPAESVLWEGSSPLRTLRGGSWVNTAGGVRASSRAGFSLVVATAYCGFRCVHGPR